MLELSEHVEIGAYIPPVADPVSTTVLFRGNTSSRLGRIIVAAQVSAGTGIVPEKPMRVYPSYALMIVVRGKGRYRDARGCSVALAEGDCVLVFPELPHMYNADAGTKWDEFYVVFEGPIFDFLKEQGILNPERPVHHLNRVDYWRRRFLSAVTLGGDRPDTMETEALFAFAQVLTEAFPLRSTSDEDEPTSWWVDEARRLLDGNFGEKLSLPSIARRLGVPYDRFRREFKAATGIAPGQYREMKRQSAACELLRFTQMSLREVADTLGYADEFHFSNSFKAAAGVSPRTFRKSLSM